LNGAARGIINVSAACLLADNNLANDCTQEQSNELSKSNSALCLRVGLLPATSCCLLDFGFRKTESCFRSFRKISKKLKPISCPSARDNSVPSGRNFVEFVIWELFGNLPRQFNWN